MWGVEGTLLPVDWWDSLIFLHVILLGYLVVGCPSFWRPSLRCVDFPLHVVYGCCSNLAKFRGGGCNRVENAVEKYIVFMSFAIIEQNIVRWRHLVALRRTAGLLRFDPLGFP